jgi:hypothetical protein
MTRFWRSMVIAGVVLGIILGILIGPSVWSLIRLAADRPTDNDAGWASKMGWQLCSAAIAAWPQKAAQACWKLAICDNEGALTPSERARLDQMLREAHCDR